MSKAKYPLVGERRSSHMDDTTSDNLDQADEEVLTPTVSDEALEAVVYNPHCACRLKAGHEAFAQPYACSGVRNLRKT
jgi:hypothetical protein